MFGQAVTGAAVLPTGVLRRPLPPSQCSSSTRPGADSEQASKQERGSHAGRASKQERGSGAPESVSAVSSFFTGTVYLRGRWVREGEGCERTTERLYLGGLGLELMRLVH